MDIDSAPEEWRPVPGYERTYEVSDLGRVRSLPRPSARGGLIRRKPSTTGYAAVGLCQDGTQKTRTVHLLVASAFMGPTPEGQEVRHLNGDRSDPRLVNLTFGTRSDNNRDKRSHGTDHNVLKTHCPQDHAYDEANTYVAPSRPTARYCRTCMRERGAAFYLANKATKRGDAARAVRG